MRTGTPGVRVDSEKIVLFFNEASIVHGCSMKQFPSGEKSYHDTKRSAAQHAALQERRYRSVSCPKHFRQGALLLVVCVLMTGALTAAGCRMQSESGPENVQGDDELGAPAAQVALSKKLKEISGLAADERGRLFAHDDESGIIYQLDPATGKVVKSFRLGRSLVTEDFEGIAIVGDRFFMVTSSGDLFEFPEGPDEGRVEYRVYKTFLSRDNDVEGLCYDPVTGTLLLAYKADPGPGLKKARAVYAFSLEERELLRTPRFVLKRKDIERQTRGGTFEPSAIERHPGTGNFFLLAAQGESLLEISPKGRIISQKKLGRKRHSQTEGLTFLPNGDMLISDEGATRGMLTRYSR